MEPKFDLFSVSKADILGFFEVESQELNLGDGDISSFFYDSILFNLIAISSKLELLFLFIFIGENLDFFI